MTLLDAIFTVINSERENQPTLTPMKALWKARAETPVEEDWGAWVDCFGAHTAEAYEKVVRATEDDLRAALA